MRGLAIFLGMYLHLVLAWGQNFPYQIRNDIPVSNAKGPLASAWAGGLNAATFSTLDFDLDGQKDLLVLDRQQNRPLVFLSKQKTYQYAPELASLLPLLNHYALFYDYDKDNKPDLFTATPIGMQAYRNVSTSSQVRFQLFQDPVLTRYYDTEPSNMSLTVLDVPFLTDIDKDGDMDVIHFNSQTGENAMLETNFSMEKYKRPDSLYFGTTNEKWGGFSENSCTNYYFGSDGRVSYNYNTRLDHIGSGALTVFDADNNGFPDLLVGKIDCQNLNFLKNNGSGTVTFYDKLTSSYPSSFPANSLYYPVSCLEDVDFDGLNDLLVTTGLTVPNAETDLQHTAWWYKNTGSNAVPNFQFQMPDFIQNTMIDHGQNTVPALADADGDGDIDLFISNSSNLSSIPSSIFYYQNTGTASNPAFMLADTNYYGLASEGYQFLSITFADLNHDGKQDLTYVGIKDGQYDTQIAYNQSSIGLDLGPSVSLGLSLVEPASLCFYPIDSDSLPDLLLGDASGNLSYYMNTGTGNSPSFAHVQSNYGGLNSDYQNASAAVCDIDKDFLPDLVFLNDSGYAKICLDFLHQSSAQFAYTSFQSDENTAPFGQQLILAAADLSQDGYPELFIGSASGGISLLKFSTVTPGLSDNLIGRNTAELKIWPNPSDGLVEIAIPEFGMLKINDGLGRQILSSQEDLLPSSKQVKLSSGLYVATFWGQSGRKYTQKLVIR